MNLFELFVKIGVDDQASGKLKDLGGKLGNGLKTAAKIGTAAVGAAAAGITALTTAAVNNYAEYEQLVGGVDTLFKDASQKVQEYAANAYKTAGMSANDYMENATAFSASLISSLGGDTEKAAEYANRAMVSMSDNANRMGTSLDSIVQTYQSLSRGNFAMLDNLKLGYGGTKAELKRLIKDAASYTDIQKEMGVTVDASSMSFDNIVNAIAVVQGKLGIVGATAQEAGTTIEGSVNSMKSAWANLLTGLADGNADISELVNNLVTTIVGDGSEENLGVFGNIMPAVETALTGASTLIGELLPEIVQLIPTIITENLPILAEAAISIIQSLVEGISENQEMLMTTALETITYLANSLITMLPQIVALGLNLIVSLASGISENLPGIIPTVIEVVNQIITTITENLPLLISSALEIITSLASGISESLPELIPTIIGVILQIVDTLTNPDMLSKILDAALVLIINLAYGLMDAIPQLFDAVLDIIDNLVVFLLDPENIAKILNAALHIIIALGTGLIDAIPRLLGSSATLIKKLVNNFKETDWGKVGKNIVDGLLDGLKKAWKSLTKWFSNAWDNLVGGVKDLLGIHSPSRVFAGIGKNMALGVSEGWDDEYGAIEKTIEDGLDFTAMYPSGGVSFPGVGGRSGGRFGNVSYGSVTFNIYAREGQDYKEIAQAVADLLQMDLERRENAFA